jgi:hypothetical protein
LPIVRIGLAEASRFPKEVRHVYTEPVLKGNLVLADLLEKQSKAGNIRSLEYPFLTAKAFMGMLIFRILTQELLGGKEITPIKREDWINEAVRIFLEGLVIDANKLDDRDCGMPVTHIQRLLTGLLSAG